MLTKPEGVYNYYFCLKVKLYVMQCDSISGIYWCCHMCCEVRLVTIVKRPCLYYELYSFICRYVVCSMSMFTCMVLDMYVIIVAITNQSVVSCDMLYLSQMVILLPALHR